MDTSTWNCRVLEGLKRIVLLEHYGTTLAGYSSVQLAKKTLEESMNVEGRQMQYCVMTWTRMFLMKKWEMYLPEDCRCDFLHRRDQ